jgi:tetratricopeptide (TPR) repeat protein
MKRPRLTVEALQRAIAFNVLSENPRDTATCIGNLSLQYSELSHYADAIRLQQMALEQKERLRAEPAAIARSWRIMAEAHLYLGNYWLGIECIHNALGVMEGLGETELSRQLKETQSWLKERLILSQAVEMLFSRGGEGELPVWPTGTLDATVADLAEIWLQAQKAAQAHGSDDREAEMRQRYRLAEMLVKPGRMYADGQKQFHVCAQTAQVAERRGDWLRSVLAEGEAAMEVGEFSTARRVLENAVAVASREGEHLLGANAAALVSMSYREEGEGDSAERYLTRALLFCGELGDEAACDWMRKEGTRLLRRDAVEDGIRVLREAKQRIRERQMVAREIYYELAHGYYLLEDWSRAILTLQESLRIGQETRDAEAVMATQARLALCLAAAGQAEAALEMIEQIDLGSAPPHVMSALREVNDRLTPLIYSGVQDLTRATAESGVYGLAAGDPLMLREAEVLRFQLTMETDPARLAKLHGALADISDRFELNEEAAQHYKTAFCLGETGRALIA